MKYPHIQQHDERDCGAACLSMVLKYFGSDYSLAKIRELIKVDNQGANIYGIVSGAEETGLLSEALEGSPDELRENINNKEISYPFIARIINEVGYEHFVVVYGMTSKKVILGDPAKSKISYMNSKTFFEQWQGQIITFSLSEDYKITKNNINPFRRFFKYVSNQKKLLSFVFVLSLIITLINVSGVFVFQYVINYSIYNEELNDIEDVHNEDSEHSHDHSEPQLEEELVVNTFGRIDSALAGFEQKLNLIFDNMTTVCVTIIFMYLFQGLINILRGYLLSLTAKKVDVPLTMDYYKYLLELPLSFFSTRKTGEYMARFNDTAKIRDAVSTTTLIIMLDSIMALACGVILFYINKLLFLITLAILLIYSVIMFSFKSPIKSINHEVMEHDAQVTSYLKETIDGIETIKAYNYEKEVNAKAKKKYHDFASHNVKANVIEIIQESFVTIVESVGIVVLLWVGALLCGKNIITLSDLFIFYYIIRYFLEPVKNLINLQPELQSAIVAAERLNDILDSKKEDNDKLVLDSAKGDIKLENIHFRYGYREPVINGVTMTFKKGSKTAIVGETGCGKTTIAKLLMAFEKPESGTITIDGKELSVYSPYSIRNKISYISQNIYLFSDTIYNNLRVGNDNITDEKIHELCKKCGLDDFIKSMPFGYNTVLEENGRNLSGGQKQRFAIVRALLREPDVLIMDEATSNLDSISESAIQNIIEQFSDNMTCIIIAHRLNTVKNCDNIFVLNNGSIVEEGTHLELIENGRLYSSYVTALNC